MLENKRLTRLFPWLLVGLIVAVSFSVNFSILNTQQAPPGADYGNYLTQVNILNGNDLRGWGLRHQPVFFVLLDGFLQAFDQLTALKVAAAFVFSIVAVPLFLLARKLSGSNVAAAITTGLFAFFIVYAEMISWGGNPNFLGFFFMLFALYFIIDFVNKPSKKNIVLSGLFLSLVIGTHILAAMFTFASLAVFAILHLAFAKNRKERIRGSIKYVFYLFLTVALFSLPYISFYLTFFRNSSREMVSFRLLEIQFSAISVSDIWALLPGFFVISVVGALGLYWLTKYPKENKSNALLLFSLFLTPGLLFLTTSQPIRWAYFLPFPFLLCFSIFLKNLFADLKHAKRNTVVLFTSLFIVTIALQSSALGINHLIGQSGQPGAVEFYQFMGKDQIEALNWIKLNTPAKAIFATSGDPRDVGGGGNSYAWWIEGYANRISMFTGDLEFYSFQFERNEVRVTNHIFAGTYAVDYGNIEATESYPSSSDNPRISAFVDTKYQNLLTINDGQNQIFFSPADNNQSTTIAPFYAKNKTATVDNSTGTITVTYTDANFDLMRTVVVGEEKSSVDITYQITPKNVTLNLFQVNLWGLFETSLEKCNVSNNSVVTLNQMEPDGNEKSETQITVLETNGKLLGSSVLFENPQLSWPSVKYRFEPTQNNLSVHFRVTVQTPDTDAGPEQEIKFYNSYDQLNDLQINYILLNKGRDNEYQRFLADSSHFTMEFEDASMIIFKVHT